MTEPAEVYPEILLQKAVVTLLREILTSARREFAILERFGLDIAIFIQMQESCAVRFIETKVFGAQRMGGVGFGNSKGEGAQVDLLLASDTRLPLFDEAVRWVYADATQPPGSRRYSLFKAFPELVYPRTVPRFPPKTLRCNVSAFGFFTFLDYLLGYSNCGTAIAVHTLEQRQWEE